MIMMEIEIDSSLHLSKDQKAAKTFNLQKGIINSRVCPRCRSFATEYTINKNLNSRFKCNTCSNYYTSRNNTFIHDMKIKFNIVFLLIKLFIDDFSPKKAYTIVNECICEKVTLKTIRNFFFKIRKSLRTQVFREMQSTFFTEEVEIDETMVYKEKKGYPFARGYRTQFWFIGIKSRNSQAFVIYPVMWRNRDTLLRIILKHVMTGVTIYTDSWSAYVNNRTRESYLRKFNYIHHFVNHSV